MPSCPWPALAVPPPRMYLCKFRFAEGADALGYEKAQRHLAETGGIEVSGRQIQRVVQRVGGAAQTWQERLAQPGVSSMSPLAEFGPGLRQEAIRRGLALALQVVLRSNGAPGLENLGRLCFSTAIQIVDFYHALEYAGQALEALLGSKEHRDYQRRLGRWAKQLRRDKVERMIAQTRQECTGKRQAEAVEKELGYFVNNVARMRYGTFRRQGFFIGSGVVEAGCKTVIGARCKQCGKFWGEPGVENILALRCIHSSKRLAQFWKERLNTRASRNDALPMAA